MARPKKLVTTGDNVAVKKRASKKQEDLKNFNLTSENLEDLQTKLKATLVDFNINDVLASLNKLSEDVKTETMTSEELKVLKADIKAHHSKIFETYTRVLGLISESIIEGSQRIPSNIYNLQDALETLAYGLEADNHAKLYATCKNFKIDIDRPGGKPRYYSETDLNDVREKAEEEGYRKGLNAAKANQHFDHIDLLD